MRQAIKLVLNDQVQELFDHFSSCFGIRILFYAPDGEILKVGLKHSGSRYCRLMQGSLYGRHACLQLDETKREEAAAKRDILCYKCHAGLVEAIKPIYYQDKLIGFVAIGQFRSAERVPSRVLADWVSKYTDRKLQTAFHSLPYVTKQRADDILALFSVLVDYIVARRMIAIQGDEAIESLLAYMAEHIKEDISIDDAARVMDVSPSTITHAFAKKMGMSFRQYLINMRIDLAERMMDESPGMKIADVAAEVGYADALYFSRLYRKHRGFPPSGYGRK